MQGAELLTLTSGDCAALASTSVCLCGEGVVVVGMKVGGWWWWGGEVETTKPLQTGARISIRERNVSPESVKMRGTHDNRSADSAAVNSSHGSVSLHFLPLPSTRSVAVQH